MKARYLKECDGHVPGDPSTPKVWQVGEINDLPDCWKLCRPGSWPVKDERTGKMVIYHDDPICEPADQECYDRVVKWYAVGRRQLPPHIKPLGTPGASVESGTLGGVQPAAKD